MNKNVMGGGAIIVGILIALTVFMDWPNSLHYLWSVLVLIWGITIYMKK
tara:strand:- start:115 stop:261 length:147 start_codon:yes stop_codon:yes gene_type:complete